MQISANSVVAIEYTLTGDDGQVIDTSKGASPWSTFTGTTTSSPGSKKALRARLLAPNFPLRFSPLRATANTRISWSRKCPGKPLLDRTRSSLV